MFSLSYLFNILNFRATSRTFEQLHERDLKMTWTLSLICSCYIIFVMPISLINMYDDFANSYALHLCFFCIYWFQYTLNFVIYALRSKRYRKAYIYFLQQSWLWLNTFFRCKRPMVRIRVNSQEILKNGDPILNLSNQQIETISLSLQPHIRNSFHVSQADELSTVLVYSKKTKNIRLDIQTDNVFKLHQNSSPALEVSRLRKYHSL